MLQINHSQPSRYCNYHSYKLVKLKEITANMLTPVKAQVQWSAIQEIRSNKHCVRYKGDRTNAVADLPWNEGKTKIKREKWRKNNWKGHGYSYKLSTEITILPLHQPAIPIT